MGESERTSTGGLESSSKHLGWVLSTGKIQLVTKIRSWMTFHVQSQLEPVGASIATIPRFQN